MVTKREIDVKMIVEKITNRFFHESSSFYRLPSPVVVLFFLCCLSVEWKGLRERDRKRKDEVRRKREIRYVLGKEIENSK
jgi:hypothetical protein